MKAVLPGQPPPKLQALVTASWNDRRIVAYISGWTVVVLGGPSEVLQTIYLEDTTAALETLAIDEGTGRIAVSSRFNVFVYEPFIVGGVPKWSLSHDFRATCDFVRTLSFGIADELLLGGSQLELWNLSEPHLPRLIWSTKLANPVKFAEFSHDGTYIASTGQYDRMVKIWKRMTFGTDDVSFEVSYLRHPTVVTSISWRRPDQHHQYHHHPREASTDNAVYTICADNKFRIWIAGEHGPHTLGPSFRHWADIDMEKSILPTGAHPQAHGHKTHGHGRSRRYGFMINCRDFCAAIERAVQLSPESPKASPVLNYLTKIASNTPEIFVVLDGRNHMSAWGIKGFDSKEKSPAAPNAIFEITHVDGVQLSFAPKTVPEEDYARFISFSDKDKIIFLAHHFDGRIEWVESKVDILFDSSPRKTRVHTSSIWSGHDGIIKKIVRDVSGNILVSRTNDSTALIWRQKRTQLVRQSALHSDNYIHRSCVLEGGQFMVNLHRDGISLWDVRFPIAKCLANCVFDMGSKPICVLQLPAFEVRTVTVYVAAVAADMSGIVWEINLPEQSDQKDLLVSDDDDDDATGHRQRQHYPKIEKFCSFRLEGEHDFSYILPVDPAGTHIRTSAFLDVFAVDIALSYTKTGTITTWTARIDQAKRTVDWLKTSTVETGIQNPSLASGTSIRKAAIVSDRRTELTIWDTRSAQLEFQETFDQEDVIRDLDWTSTPDDQSILAVGFPHKVVFLSQLRYDYLDETPSWARIREVCISSYTPHPIGDSCWMGNGGIVVGTGNQLYIYNKEIDAANPTVARLRMRQPSKPGRMIPATANMFDVVTRLNGALPVFHPQFLSQSILAGKIELVHFILTSLNRKLKYFTPGDPLDGFLDIPLEVIYNSGSHLQHNNNLPRVVDFSDEHDTEEESYILNESITASLQENLTRVALPQISSGEQFRLLDIVQCVATVEKYRRSMDDNATRYLLFFREHLMRKGQKLHNLPTVSWREIVWAQHSDSHEILTDLASRQYNNGRLLWENAKECGMFMWLGNATALKAQLEIVARNEYIKTEERNPIDCTLFYLILGKKNVIQGLWRMAHWNREQKATSQLLSQDFKQTRWKRAALKNAFALLSKRRFHYAAAFFLLGGGVRDAAYICLNKLGDVQLAITIARVCEGDDSPLLRELLQDHILPTAVAEGNRWMATWAFWLLNRRDLAVRALIEPIERLLPQTTVNTAPRSLHAKSYLANDPALIVLYQQLREKTLQTMKGASHIRGKDEWDLILRTAGLYSRMGCDLLALNLVSHWQFLEGPEPSPPPQQRQRHDGAEAASAHMGGHDDRRLWTPGHFRRKSSLVIADLPTLEQQHASGHEDRPTVDNKEKEKEENPDSDSPPTATAVPSDKNPTTHFVEPDANSLLDNFGF